MGKSCFVICPIGEAGSEVRSRADELLEFIFAPVATALGYDDPIRADRMVQPGIITSQVIDQLRVADLVIADLTGGNPNVFYELAVRHAVKKPLVQVCDEGFRIPFDVQSTRTIKFAFAGPRSVRDFKERLRTQILAVESDPADVDNPISVAIDLDALRASGDRTQAALARATDRLDALAAQIGEIDARTRRGVTLREMLARRGPWPRAFESGALQPLDLDWSRAAHVTGWGWTPPAGEGPAAGRQQREEE